MDNFIGPYSQWTLVYRILECMAIAERCRLITQQSSSAKWIRTREMWWRASRSSRFRSDRPPWTVADVLGLFRGFRLVSQRISLTRLAKRPVFIYQKGHENFQHLWSSNMMTNFKEGYPSTRRSSTKKIFKLSFTPFCPSLELPSYDIAYVT